MKHLKSIASVRPFLTGMMLLIFLNGIFLWTAEGQSGNEEQDAQKRRIPYSKGKLEVYEKKTLFIFPVVYGPEIDHGVISDSRKHYLKELLHYMFVIDFKRINYYSLNAESSVDTFLVDAQAYIRNNIREISTRRLQPDGKLNEEMVTEQDLLKTSENSFLLVPYIDSIERKTIGGGDCENYEYYAYLHFDVYSTKEKLKIGSFPINNENNIIGMLASGISAPVLSLGELEHLSKSQKNDELSFRKVMGKLFTVLKNKLKQMPQFRLKGELTFVGASTFGFDMGRDNGIRIDERYKTWVTKENGQKNMTGFGKIRKVKESFSEAQTLIGSPEEGDQLEEDPKLGVTILGGYGMAPITLRINGINVSSGPHTCILFGLEYELGPSLGLSEWYSILNFRVGSPKQEHGSYSKYNSMAHLLVNIGLLKRFCFGRFSLNFSGALGLNNVVLKKSWSEISGSGIGFTFKSSLEMLLTPEFSLYGGCVLDFYANPGKIKIDNFKEDFPSGWEWNARGLSINVGAKLTI